MKKALLIDDECWLRVQARDASADGRFVFAVRTTGVFCRPSCRSKRALRKNVRFFANAQQALDAGFRPCKRCQPDNARAHYPADSACRGENRRPAPAARWQKSEHFYVTPASSDKKDGKKRRWFAPQKRNAHPRWHRAPAPAASIHHR